MSRSLLAVVCVFAGACVTAGDGPWRTKSAMSAESLPNGATETASWAPLPTCGGQAALPPGFQPLPLNDRCMLRFDDGAASPALVIDSAADLASRLVCPPDDEQLPQIDFAASQVVIVVASSDDPMPFVSFVAQGSIVTAVQQLDSHCPGGMAREWRNFVRALLVPRQPSLRARLVVCRAPAPDCSGPPRP